MRCLAILALLAIPAFAPAADPFVYVSLAGEKKIALYRMAADGKPSHAADLATDGEPGALATDPNRRFLFAAIRSAGQLASFRIDAATGKLTPLGTVEAGADPAHVATDRTGKFLLTAYYVAAKVTVHAVAADGSLGAKPLQTVPTAKNAHAVAPDPSNRFVFVPHTGPNTVFQFAFRAETGRLAANAVPKLATPAQTGPRHLVFHPSKNIAYIDNEQGGSVTAYTFDAKPGTLAPLQTVSTLPKDFTGTNACAEIKIHPSGKFLYVSNRGHDSIARFTLDAATGKLTATGRTPTEKTPRSFDLDPEGKFLFAAGEASGKLAAYRIDPVGGQLERLATYPVGPRPWCVLAVAPPAK